MARVVQRPKAVEDLREIWRWVARDKPQAANKPMARLDAAILLGAECPRSGVARFGLAARLRSLSVHPHLIFFRPTEGGIEVVRVLDGRRDIGPELFEDA